MVDSKQGDATLENAEAWAADLLEIKLARMANEQREDRESIQKLERRLVERESELLRLRDAFHHLKEALLEDRGLRTGCTLCNSSSYHEDDCPLGVAILILRPEETDASV